MQNCQFSAAQQALDAYGSAARELRHAELVWHYERTCIVLKMNAGDFPHARKLLSELKCQADRLELQGAKAITAIDWGELNRQTVDIRPFASQYSRALSADPNDDVTVQTGKLRMLVQFGLLDEARTRLQRFTLQELRLLPKSRDYLAQLANLARATSATGTRGHAEVLYELLRPYPDLYIASLSLHCHGLVSHVLGTLARGLDSRERAREHFEYAVVQHQKLGVRLPLMQSRQELGSLLLSSANRNDRAQGRDILAKVREDAEQLGLLALRAEIDGMLG